MTDFKLWQEAVVIQVADFGVAVADYLEFCAESLREESCKL